MPIHAITLKVVFKYTYEKEEVDEDLGEGVAEPCNLEHCKCDGTEEPLNAQEVDEFMCARYCGKSRYYWYATSLMGKTISDVSYDRGTLTFRVSSDLDAESLKDWILGRDFYDCFFEGCPGNEALVPTRHRYSYTTLSSFLDGSEMDVEYADKQLGYIECRNAETIWVE